MNGKGLWGMNMIVGLSVLGGTLYIARAHVFVVKTCLFSFSPQFSESAKKNIIDYVKESLPHTGSSTVALSSAVMQQFSFVKKVRAHLLPSQATRIIVDAVEPTLCVNDAYLLAAESDCVLKELFAASYTAQLPTITCASGDVPVALHHCKQKFSSALCNAYDVIWHDEFCIRLQDKQESKFSILCGADSIPDEQCVSRCQQLKKVILEQSDTRKTMRGKQWVADVRFNNQIVVYTTKEGVVYG